MSELDALLVRLRNAPHGELRAIERKTGVPYGTIRRIKDAQAPNPRVDTVKRIWVFYQDQVA